MSYQVLARKWRPRLFTELVGQDHVVRALINGLDHERLHHAFLFTGTRGVGKTTIARILAKSLNCERGVSSTPCAECASCREIDDGRFVDLIEVDAASRTKVEDTRDLLENVQYAPARGRYKVYLIDEVHMLSNHSFNALLKTLEEPPPHVKFLLATTDPQKLPVTVLSRCLQFNLKRLPVDLIQGQMATILDREGVGYEPAGLLRLARAADGSMRDGLSLLDQAIAFGAGRVPEAEVCAMLGSIDRGHVFAVLSALARHDGPAVLAAVEGLAEQAPDFAGVLQELTSVLHRIALVQVIPDAADTGDENDGQLLRLTSALSPEDVQLYYQIAITGQRDLPLAPDPRSGFEMVLLRMLAFRPAAAPARDTASVSETPSRLPVRGTSQERSQPAESKPVAPGHEPPPEPSGRLNPAFGVEPVMARSEVAATGSAPSPDRLGSSPNWNAMVAGLGLGGGIARELANNCQFLGREQDTVRLCLDPAHVGLRSARVEERLRAALEKYFEAPIRLDISVGEPALETPAQQRARRSHERRQAAVHAIQEDANVRGLVERFDAKVLQESIEPLEPPDSES